MITNKNACRGSVETLLTFALMAIALAVVTSNEFASRRRIAHIGSVTTNLTALYVGEFTLVHVIAYKKTTGRDICPDANRACQINFSPNVRAPGLGNRSLYWNIAKLAFGFESAHAGDQRQSSQNNASPVGSGDASRTESGRSSNFSNVQNGSVRVLTSDVGADGRFVCSVFSAPDGKERQLCIKEAPRPEVTLLVNGSAAPISNLAPNGSVTVSYSTRFADSCTLSANQAVAPALTSESVSAAGGTRSYSLPSPLTNYTFTLSCTSVVGTTTASAQVNTTNHAPRVTLRVNGAQGPISAEAGTRLSITWSTEHCTSVALTTTPFIFASAQASGSNGLSNPVPANQKVTVLLACVNQAGRTEVVEEVFTYRKVPVYRAYNPIADCHFYTANEAEYRSVTQGSGYLPEGVRFFAYETKWKDSIFPIRRLYNTAQGCHYYTMNGAEVDIRLAAVPAVWREETNLAFGALSKDPQVPGSEEVFHLYNQRSGSHLFTANDAERSYVLRAFGDIWVQHNSLGFAIAAELPTNALPKTIPIFRAYNPNTSQHFFTQNCGEYQAVVRAGWNPEGRQLFLWEGPLSGAAIAAKRYGSSNGISHLYTTQLKPEDGPGWVEEPSIGFVTPYRSNSMVEVFHFKHVNGNHFYTTNRAEIVNPATNQPAPGWSVAPSLGWAPASGDAIHCPVQPVPPAPVSTSLLVDGATSPAPKIRGASFTVTWSSANAATCDLRVGSRTVSNDINNTIAGVVVGPILANETVRLNCSGPGGSDSKQAVITVREPIAVYLLSPRCTDGRAPFESETPQDFGSCSVSFTDDCAVQKDGAQWGYASRADSDKTRIDADTKNLILEHRLGICRGTSCSAQGGWDRGTYQCDGKARVVRYR